MGTLVPKNTGVPPNISRSIFIIWMTIALKLFIEFQS